MQYQFHTTKSVKDLQKTTVMTYKQPHNSRIFIEVCIYIYNDVAKHYVSTVQLLGCKEFYERKGFGCGSNGCGKLGVVVPLYGCCLIWLILGRTPPSPGDVLVENGFANAVNKTFCVNKLQKHCIFSTMLQDV